MFNSYHSDHSLLQQKRYKFLITVAATSLLSAVAGISILYLFFTAGDLLVQNPLPSQIDAPIPFITAVEAKPMEPNVAEVAIRPPFITRPVISIMLPAEPRLPVADLLAHFYDQLESPTSAADAQPVEDISEPEDNAKPEKSTKKGELDNTSLAAGVEITGGGNEISASGSSEVRAEDQGSDQGKAGRTQGKAGRDKNKSQDLHAGSSKSKDREGNRHD